jgi:hypothetical protein
MRLTDVNLSASLVMQLPEGAKENGFLSHLVKRVCGLRLGGRCTVGGGLVDDRCPVMAVTAARVAVQLQASRDRLASASDALPANRTDGRRAVQAAASAGRARAFADARTAA